MEIEIIKNPDRHLKKFLTKNGYQSECISHDGKEDIKKKIKVDKIEIKSQNEAVFTSDNFKKLKKPRQKKSKEEKEEAKKNRSPEEQAKINDRIKKMNESKLKKKNNLFN